ncbi:MAG TPA: hypothetical protein VMT94_08495 [Burkholderiales bacterium]|nr:hypothetical protein [Burkholderiales bacterium]
MNKWKLLRVGLISFVALSSFLVPLGPQAKPSIDWSTLAIIFLFIPIGLLFVIGIQAINPMSAKVWHKPNWNLNPMNFKDPVQFFHLGAYVMLAQGIVTLCRISFSNVLFYPEALLPIVMGVGMLFGIQIVMLVFRKKYSEYTSDHS